MYSSREPTMLKTSPSRNQRSKGLKVKHVLQIFVLLASSVWLVNQLKHSYDKKEGFEDSSEKIPDEVQSEHEILKLGRKGLHTREEMASNFESQGENEELEEETEDIKSEETENEERGGGDDEIDGHDQAEEEEPEEVEDLTDVDDRERDMNTEKVNIRNTNFGQENKSRSKQEASV